MFLANLNHSVACMFWKALMQHITPTVRYGCSHCGPVNHTEGLHIPQEHVQAYSLLPGNNSLLRPFKMCSPFREWRSWRRTLPGAPPLHKSLWSHHKLQCRQANTCNTWPKYKMKMYFTPKKKNKSLRIHYCTYCITSRISKTNLYSHNLSWIMVLLSKALAARSLHCFTWL